MIHQEKPNNKNLIIFFIPDEKLVNGGIISIFSLCKESRRYYEIHKSDVVICTYPGRESYGKNNLFENDEKIFSFEEVKNKYPSLKKLVLHIPEYASTDVSKKLKDQKDYISKIDDLRINILDQNIEMMPPLSTVALLFTMSKNITQTTAHLKYCTQEMANYYCIPTHLMSVAIDKDNYIHEDYSNKKDQIIMSPDYHPEKEQIIKHIKRELPKYKIVEVSGMKYEEYKKLIAESKFTITFGEGFDGYYIESIFSNTLAFAVYNDEFFPTKDFLDLRNIYKNYSIFLKEIVSNIKQLENSIEYKKTINSNSTKLEKIYNYSVYLKNIEQYYQGKYTYIPDSNSLINFLINVTNENNQTIMDSLKQINQLEAQIQKTQEVSEYQSVTIDDMLNSRSWRLTKPLRRMSQKVKKARG